MTAAAAHVVAALRDAASPTEHAKVLARVGDPDRVIGVRMGTVFELARRHVGLESADIEALLAEPAYEARMVAVSVLDLWARRPRATQDERRRWADLYLGNHHAIDVWDLVDRAAPRVVGGWLLGEADRSILRDLADSDQPMRRRTAITACFWLVRHGELDDALAMAARLVDDPEPMVRSNVGVALREVGRVDTQRRDAFLVEHADRVPAPARRTASAS